MDKYQLLAIINAFAPHEVQVAVRKLDEQIETARLDLRRAKNEANEMVKDLTKSAHNYRDNFVKVA